MLISNVCVFVLHILIEGYAHIKQFWRWNLGLTDISVDACIYGILLESVVLNDSNKFAVLVQRSLKFVFL